jgi:hypothetical protein
MSRIIAALGWRHCDFRIGRPDRPAAAYPRGRPVFARAIIYPALEQKELTNAITSWTREKGISHFFARVVSL